MVESEIISREASEGSRYWGLEPISKLRTKMMMFDEDAVATAL